MQLITVYLMPGLAASPLIFQKLKLSESQFKTVLLEWQLPLSLDESLSAYAKRMALKVTAKNAVLVGVSFGGILVQEMAQFCEPQKTIIISSVKCRAELPVRMHWVADLKIYNALPYSLASHLQLLKKMSFGDYFKKRVELYEKFLSVNDKLYLKWAVKNVVQWERKSIDTSVIHIHGTADEIFPTVNLKGFIAVEGGSHIMILNKYKWLNENLPQIIKNE